MESFVLSSTLGSAYEAQCRDYFRSGHPIHPFKPEAGFLGTSLDGTYESSDGVLSGEILVRVRSEAGVVATPIGKFFATRPSVAEGFNDHGRVDCFVRKHALSPDPQAVAALLADVLEAEGLCSRPLWVSWYQAEELGGEARGEVFEQR